MARSRLAIALASLALAAAACGSSGATAVPSTPEAPAATEAPTPASAAPAASEATTSAPSEAPAASDGAGASAATCEVTPDATGEAAAIKGFAFPADLSVPVGGAITWTNNDSVPHTVTFEDGSCTSGTIAGGGTATVTYAVAGSYPFLCRIHPRMTGTLTVGG